MWLPDDDDEYLGFPPETVVIKLSQDQAQEGIYSVKCEFNDAPDDSTAWVERSAYLIPHTTYKMNMSFWVWSNTYSEVNRWPVLAYTGSKDPEVESDFTMIGETNLVTGWKKYTYSKEVQTDNIGRVYVAGGITRTWEGPRTYYLDSVALSFTPK